MIEVLDDNGILFLKFIKQKILIVRRVIVTILTLNYVSRWKFLMSLLEIKCTFCHCVFIWHKKMLQILIFENVKTYF